MSQYYQLWMGSLESYMTESFLMNAFKKMGESPLAIKIMKNKITGDLAGYCFVHFATDEEAKTVLHKLNGKMIPGTNVRFKLNGAGPGALRPMNNSEHSLWVGELSPDVDDYMLYKCFASRYHSLKQAKVVTDNNGFSKGYAFVRFGLEEEQLRCVIEMNGYKGLGNRPIRVSSAVPRSANWKKSDSLSGFETSTTTAESTPAQSYYDPSMWQGYAGYYPGYYETSQTQSTTADYTASSTPSNANSELELIEHTVNFSVQDANNDFLSRDCELWFALASSKWLPVESCS